MDTWLALSPALIAITIALVSKRIEIALAVGVVWGGLVAADFELTQAAKNVTGFVGASLGFDGGTFSPDHLEITAFSLAVGATVTTLSATGSTHAVIQWLERYAQGRRGAMVTSWLAGMVVFFDDYANCLVVGNAMGPLCDRHGVSRSKLAYIVDSTAAPIASLAVVSTWVGYEVGLLADQLGPEHPPAMTLFLWSIPYRFYSLFTLAFVGMIAVSGRDFGPMAREEASNSTASKAPMRTTASPGLAVASIALLVGGTLAWLTVDGWGNLPAASSVASQGVLLFAADLLGGANPYHAMLFGSLAGLTLAVGGAVTASGLGVRETWKAVQTGVGHVLPALVVLFLAWSLGGAMEATHAGEVLSGVLAGQFPGWALPSVTFVLAGGIAFATGTSFGTMALLIPIALPLALGFDEPVLWSSTTAAVLAGSCFGDHASPISDTTILSAAGAGVSVVDHVRTQAPYALTTGGVAVLFGYLPVGMGLPVLPCLVAGLLACGGIVWGVGRAPVAQSANNAS